MDQKPLSPRSAADPADSGDPFAATAPFYDLDLDGYDEDLALYRDLVEGAAGAGARVLELGCGTGRIAVPLARAGHSVVGVDSSPAMLAEARRLADEVLSGPSDSSDPADSAASPASALSPDAVSLDAAERAAPAEALTLLEADVRDLDLGRRFDVVLVPLGGMQHMEDGDDLVACCRTVARHLAPDGVAIVDIELPHADDLIPGPRPLVEHWTRPWRGGQVTKLVAVDNAPAEGMRHVTFHYDIQPADGALRRVSHRFALRVITPGELALAARLGGLALTARYGDYALSPLDDGSERLIAVLEPADRAEEE